VEVIYNAVIWLNCFAHKDGKNVMLVPHNRITRLPFDYNKHCTLQFGTYVQVHEPHDNSLMPRTVGSIALTPSGNAQCSYYFLSLHSSKRVIRNKWMVLRMPAEVITTVHQLATTCKNTKA